MSTQTIKELTSAREKVAQGWVQGAELAQDQITGNLSYCIVGALRYAVLEVGEHDLQFLETSDRMHRDCEVLNLALKELRPEENWLGDVIEFNDHPGRIQDEVIEVFDRAIKIAERDDL